MSEPASGGASRGGAAHELKEPEEARRGSVTAPKAGTPGDGQMLALSREPSAPRPASTSRDDLGMDRILGMVEGRSPGPTVVLVGGIHGNEPAGIEAIQAVLEAVQRLPLRGEVVGVAGNLEAIRQRRRFVRRDLNRRWSEALVDGLLAADPSTLTDEDREQRGLIEVFGHIVAESRGPVVFLDLHTMSGPGAPFVCMADVLRNRRVAFALPLPVVLGLEEVIEGSMLGYLCDLGHVGVAVEGGQHEHPEAPRRLEAAAWLTLAASGVLDPDAIPGFDHHLQRLEEASRGLPSVLEIRHRHMCREDDGFEMVPGFESFQPVQRGQRVARDVRGDIHAPQPGLLMLPRYQGTGEDGFFIARPVRRFWLEVSAHLRRARADRILPRLPGVIPHPVQPETFLVDPRIARVRVVDVFHLLGYRRIRPEGNMLAFSRRRPDERGPAALPAP